MHLIRPSKEFTTSIFVYILACFSLYGVEQKPKCVAAYDVGSTSLKIIVAEIDQVNCSFDIIFDDVINYEFDITPDNAADRLSVFSEIKLSIDKLFNRSIHHEAIATSGFRRAGDVAENLAQDINVQAGINFSIVSQNIEAQLAYDGVKLIVRDFDPKNAIVWDIGGGSMQLITQGDHGELRILGSTVASRTLKSEVIKHIKKKSLADTTSPNPMKLEDVTSAKAFTHRLLKEKVTYSELKHFYSEDINWLRQKIQNGAVVYGVGLLHLRQGLKFASIVNPGIEEKKTYTLIEISQAIGILTNLTDETIAERFANEEDTEPEVVKEWITSMILIEQTMKLFGMKTVDVVQINNTEGIIAKYIRTCRDN